jgi:hypothetical protein
MSEGVSGPEPASADEFDRALRDLTAGRPGRVQFREPSAAERARAAAAADKRARKEAARARRKARRHGRLTIPLAVLLVLALAGGLAWVRFGRRPGSMGDPTPTSQVQAVQSTATSAVSPFAGTPAAAWDNGAAGIVVPHARAIGPFTAAQVALAYSRTRKLLIAAALNKQTLLGGKPRAFERLLSNEQRSDFLASLRKTGLNKDGTDRNLRGWLVAFAPGGTVLVGSEIKVHGTMTASAGTVQGGHVLQIGINYRFVYAVEPPGQPAAWRRVIVAYGDDVEFGNWTGAATNFEPWVVWSQADSGADCVNDDGYIYPDYQTALPKGARPSGPARDPYSMAALPSTTGCVPASRT